MNESLEIEKITGAIEEHRPYQDGHFTKERREYTKTGRSRGPYWYFSFHEGGKQRKLYLGKTDNPEAALEHKRHAQERSAGGIVHRPNETRELHYAREYEKARRTLE